MRLSIKWQRRGAVTGVEDAGADFFRLTLPSGENLAGSLLVVAASRTLNDPTGVVPVACGPHFAFDFDRRRAVLADGDGGGHRLAHDPPAGEGLTGLHELFRPVRQRFQSHLAEYRSHRSPSLSQWKRIVDDDRVCAVSQVGRESRGRAVRRRAAAAALGGVNSVNVNTRVRRVRGHVPGGEAEVGRGVPAGSWLRFGLPGADAVLDQLVQRGLSRSRVTEPAAPHLDFARRDPAAFLGNPIDKAALVTTVVGLVQHGVDASGFALEPLRQVDAGGHTRGVEGAFVR